MRPETPDAVGDIIDRTHQTTSNIAQNINTKMKVYNNELSKLFEVIKQCTNIETNTHLIMLAMDKLLAFGNDENIQLSSSYIKIFKNGVNKAKEFTIIDYRFEKYISAFEKLVKKHTPIEELEQQKKIQQKKIQRAQRELARLKWTMLS